MTLATDERWMRLAISLGAQRLGQTWPNPAVGCVIVKDGRVLARAATAPGGRPHAETQALDGINAKGSTVYVSLEPCAHTGKTPPCAQALIDARVARVVYGMRDPDCRVDGKGTSMLSAAGIAVTGPVLEKQALAANQGFITAITKGRPALTLKLATSFDGRIATASGQSQWITGPNARRAVHMMRANHDAIMVGAGTARADDPTLTQRVGGIAHQPIRVICTSDLNIPMDGALVGAIKHAPLWLIHGQDAKASARDAWLQKGAKLIQVPSSPNGLDMTVAMQKLCEKGITRVFCEGGGQLAAGLLKAKLVDRLVGFTAGMALGGDGRACVGALNLDAIDETQAFQLENLREIGGDILHIWQCDC
ncbi:riboflavin biosynthesis protein RibD [Rhodobacterales bacterium HTCC2150]|nr:riboflavin biosynthesis protein RibD [Rhodobacterales bacterium HTCC2150] [Rhodobacteraceae bacterium HTCC2150]